MVLILLRGEMYITRKGPKYGNITSEFNGRIYHSKKEAGYAKILETLKKASRKEERVVHIVPQYKIDLKVNGKHICNYYMDFYVEYADGGKKFIEVKGFQTDIWRLKWKILEAIQPIEYPDIELEIIK